MAISHGAVASLTGGIVDARRSAPRAVSAFLSATATKVAILALLRVFYTVAGRATPFAALPLAETLVPLAVAGAVSGWIPARRAARGDPMVVLREE